MRGPINRLRGLTMLELMIVTALTILVSAGVFQLVRRAWLNYEALNVQNQVQREARTALSIVCDEIRSAGPWVPSGGGASDDANAQALGVQVYSDGGGTVVRKGQGTPSMGPWTLRRDSGTNSLTLEHPVKEGANSIPTPNIVHNITQFNIQFQGRIRKTDGTYVWSSPVTLNYHAAPGPSVPTDADALTLSRMQRAIVTVTASKQAANGLTYTRTLKSLVRLRNNFFTIVPPGI